ncbi:polysaccharide pyruvyl transferase family protein [Flavobacterium sp. RSP49]|uniref:polysaccharide pyruvyl transferase family protein n=1 Tax=Flavobacterium sp. RSP49 TaxID=2497487 RepID=UPI000F8431E5|nr:polysaccharide pyruvyl transferase family protein [Flavobacterium sp. RSP49]RTZ00904.1 polysaccharide pyruvyl transferase family protein [Flavobacterium sp. RSP49]
MKTVLVRAYTYCNLGDDLFLKVLVERYPEIQFTIIAPKLYEKIFKQYENVFIKQIPSSPLFKKIVMKIVGLFSISKKETYVLNIIKNFYSKEAKFVDAYIYIGGSLFMQKNEKINLIDILNKEITNIFHDKKKFVIGANFGPYLTVSYLDFYKKHLLDYDDVCFREKYSKDIFKDLLNVRNCPDVVFQLKLPVVRKEEGSIGFSLMDISWRKELSQYEGSYLSFIKELISKALDDDRGVYLFSFCADEGDEKVISRIVESFPLKFRNKIGVIRYDGEIDKFLSLYSKVESMFATRFHSMILSSLLGQNIFPIMYSEKMNNVLKDFNYKGTYSKISDLGRLNPSECLKNIINNRLEISSSIIEKSKGNFLFVDKYINNL